MRPSGAHTMDHGTSRPPTTFSTLKRVFDCGELATSPAPRPAGGRAQATQTMITTATKDHGDFSDTSWTLVLYVFVKQLDLVTLFADFHPQQIAHRQHADPPFAVDDRQVASTKPLHAFESLM